MIKHLQKTMKLISSTIAALAATSALAKVVDLNSENFDSTLKNKDLAIVKFFAPWCGHCKMMAEDWEKASNALADNDKVLIGNVDCTEERELCSSQSVQGYPTLKAFKNGVFSEETYDRKEDAILRYVKSALGGGADDGPADAGVQADPKSEDVPDNSEYKSDNIWKIVGKNFKETVLDQDKHFFLKVYAPWCGHCVAMQPAWEEFAKAMADRDDVVVAEIDATANELPTAYNVRGFPTIFWCDKGNKAAPEKYQGSRSVESWTDFVDKKAPKAKEEL